MKNLYLYTILLFLVVNTQVSLFSCNPGTLLKSFFQPSPEQLQQQWFDAARTGNMKVIKNLLKKIDVNVKDTRYGSVGYTALIHAATNGHIDIIKFLLQVPGIDVNAHEQNGDTALMWAAYRRDKNIIKMLLQHPEIDINAQNNRGYTALHEATEYLYSLDIIQLLLSAPDININAQDNEGNSPLMIATNRNFGNLVKFFLTIPDININLQNILGKTALILAAWFGYENILKLLLQNIKINVNIRDNQNDSALVSATMAGHVNIVKILLSLPDIQVHAHDFQKEFLREVKRNSPEMAKLIRHRIRELTNKAFEALRNQNIETLKAVISQVGVNDVIDKEGNTLLDKAFAINNPEIILLLLTSARDPQELLLRFPFEASQPTSEIFKLCLNLAYADSHLPGKDDSKISHVREAYNGKSCTYCAAQNCTDRCSKCQSVYYCDSGCQKKDWKKHKIVCKSDNFL